MWQAAPDNLIDSEFDEKNPVNDSGFECKRERYANLMTFQVEKT